jgi:hypothetical protein
MTPRELKKLMEARGSKFFTRGNMEHAGDTMKNFGVRDFCGKYWELYRKVGKPGDNNYWLISKSDLRLAHLHTTGQVGTVHHASHRLEHLIPAFIDAAAMLILSIEQRDTLVDVYRKSKSRGYFDSAIADCDLEWLSNTLDSKSPEGCYFGAHPGDGADFWWWECDGDDNG